MRGSSGRTPVGAVGAGVGAAHAAATSNGSAAARITPWVSRDGPRFPRVRDEREHRRRDAQAVVAAALRESPAASHRIRAGFAPRRGQYGTPMTRIACSLVVSLASLAACSSDPGAGAAEGSAEASTGPGGDGSGSASDSASGSASASVSASGSSSDGGSSGNDASSGNTDAGTDGSADSGASSESGGSTTGIGGEPNVLYVRDDGQDGNPGTIEEPMRTIQWAIAQAESAGTIDTIRIAEGSYGFDYANDAHIVVVDGISLYGGYRADWGDRDPARYPTLVVDQSATAIASSEDDPHRAIEVPASVGADTVLDGLHVEVAMGQFRAALLVAGDVTVRNSVIAPVVDASSVSTYGVRVLEGAPTVVANRFVFDVVGNDGLSFAVSGEYTDGTFADNIIDLSGLTGYGYGFYFIGGAQAVLANSVWIAAGANMTGVWLNYATPTIENNVIESEDDGAVCIWSSGGASVPAALHNNVLDCYYTLFGSDPLRSWTTIMEVEGGLVDASDNLKLPQAFTSATVDMALDETAPCTVTLGGRDLGAGFSQDIDGLTRTDPRSIGAHEWDGDCQ